MKDGNNKIIYIIVAVVVILILLLIIGAVMRNSRNKSGSVSGGSNPITNKPIETNYEVLEDGTKENNSTAIKDSEIDTGNVRFSNFSIVERTEDNDTSTDITFTMENMSDEEKTQKSFLIRLFDSNDEVISSFTINVASLQPHKQVPFRQNLRESIISAQRIEVQMIEIGNVEEAPQQAPVEEEQVAETPVEEAVEATEATEEAVEPISGE